MEVGSVGVALLKIEKRLAATDLQKRALVGFERHWGQVPGPLEQGLEAVLPFVSCCLTAGGKGGIGFVSWLWRVRSLAISAQIQGVSSEQKPHRSGGAIAGMVEDAAEVDVVKAGGRWLANCDVKSISVMSLSSGLWRTRLLSLLD